MAFQVIKDERPLRVGFPVERVQPGGSAVGEDTKFFSTHVGRAESLTCRELTALGRPAVGADDPAIANRYSGLRDSG